MSSNSQGKPGSIIGGMLLISGSCIGAGMLALPILTGMAGFFPTLVMFFIAWVFMTTTALLLVEVDGWFHEKVNFLSMIGRTLGKYGRFLGWLLYLFLFYALIIAYISTSGNHFSFLSNSFFHLNVPDWFGSLLFVIIFGWFVYLGTRPVDLANRFLMVGKILAYLALVVLGMQFVKPNKLLYSDIKLSLFSLPVLIISFGFHNMIPSLSAYMKGDIRRIKSAILGGSFFTFVVYIIWEVLALGILPVKGPGGILASYHHDIEAAQAVRNFLGSNMVGIFAQVLAFFAILTSFLAQTLSLVHFLSDGFNVRVKRRENIWMCALALVPPLVLSMTFPQLFFDALNFAGGFCAVILFGVFPVLMVWIGRYRHKIPSTYKFTGGQPLLIFTLLFAVFIVVYQLSNMCGLKLFPTP